jgi:hypothetical protein
MFTECSQVLVILPVLVLNLLFILGSIVLIIKELFRYQLHKVDIGNTNGLTPEDVREHFKGQTGVFFAWVYAQELKLKRRKQRKQAKVKKMRKRLMGIDSSSEEEDKGGVGEENDDKDDEDSSVDNDGSVGNYTSDFDDLDLDMLSSSEDEEAVAGEEGSKPKVDPKVRKQPSRSQTKAKGVKRKQRESNESKGSQTKAKGVKRKQRESNESKGSRMKTTSQITTTIPCGQSYLSKAHSHLRFTLNLARLKM